MPKKKGGGKKRGSGKLAKMTEEERILYLEQQRLAEEEFKKKREDMLSMYITEKLQKEEKASAFNTNKLNHQWRNIMRESKSKELKKEIEILSQTFERVIDRKDSVLKSLGKDLEETVEQFMRALRAHFQNMDQLLDLQNGRMETLASQYNSELDTIKEEFDTEEQFMMEQFNGQLNDLQNILVSIDQHFNENENDARMDFQNMRDEIKNKNLEEKHALRSVLESRVDELWQKFMESRRQYTETTEERKNQFEVLKEKDEQRAAQIEAQMKKIQRIQERLSGLRGKMSQNSREFEEGNQQLKEQRELMLLQFQQLKSKMNQARAKQRSKLTQMTLESNAAIKEVLRLVEQAEKILKLSENCRRLETEEEKVLPVYVSSLTEEEQADVNAAMQQEPNIDLVKAMQKYTQLDMFWRRYNKVLLDQLALEKEKLVLMDENRNLRALLKQYLDGLSVNDEVLQQQNTLMIVNEGNMMSNAVFDARMRPAPKVTIEASHIINHNVTSSLTQ